MTQIVSPSAGRRLARYAAPAAAVFFVTLVGVAATGFAETAPRSRSGTPPASGSDMRDHAERRQEWIHSRLERAENRLEIKASQQGAWQSFAQSVEALAARGASPRPGRDADATAVARYRADRASDMARKLTQVADATAKLETVLTEDQRKVLDSMAHRYMGEARWHHRGRAEHGRSEREEHGRTRSLRADAPEVQSGED